MLTKRMQIQAVADRLVGIKTTLNVAKFDEPFHTCYTAIDVAPSGTEHQALVIALEGHGKREKLIARILDAIPGNAALEYLSLQEIADTLMPIEWLWLSWIPHGMISLLGGSPGAGKSFVALDLARRIIHGEDFPDGAVNAVAGRNVIYVDAELVPQIINDRAEIWGMDTSKLYLMLPESREMIDFQQVKWQDELIEMCHSLEPALVVIDSLGSITAGGEDRVRDVNWFLGFLSALATDFGVAVLVNHHLRKKSQMQLSFFNQITLDDFRGSSHIVAMARSVLGLSVVQATEKVDPDGPRRLEVVKTNLARHPEPIGIKFEPRHPRGVTLRYGEVPERYRESTKLDEAKEWLLDVLADGPMSPKEVSKLGEEEGISSRTLHRARRDLEKEILDTEGKRHPRNEWKLREGE